jgi:hypothetical protein
MAEIDSFPFFPYFMGKIDQHHGSMPRLSNKTRLLWLRSAASLERSAFFYGFNRKDLGVSTTFVGRGNHLGWDLPYGNLTKNYAIHHLVREISHEQWQFSIVMFVYQRVSCHRLWQSVGDHRPMIFSTDLAGSPEKGYNPGGLQR